MANRSLSQNEPAEGYICPVCYFALTSQDELISHWQKAHSLENCENDVFHEVSMPAGDNGENIEEGFVVKQDNDLTVIEMPVGIDRSVSTAEDVVKSFNDEEKMFHETNEESASDASGDMDGSQDSTQDVSGHIVGSQDGEQTVLPEPPPTEATVEP